VTSTAPLTSDRNTGMTALLVIGSILWFGKLSRAELS
jgi:hypothetical protein